MVIILITSLILFICFTYPINYILNDKITINQIIDTGQIKF